MKSKLITLLIITMLAITIQSCKPQGKCASYHKYGRTNSPSKVLSF